MWVARVFREEGVSWYQWQLQSKQRCRVGL